jgi:hypothetical protein
MPEIKRDDANGTSTGPALSFFPYKFFANGKIKTGNRFQFLSACRSTLGRPRQSPPQLLSIQKAWTTLSELIWCGLSEGAHRVGDISDFAGVSALSSSLEAIDSFKKLRRGIRGERNLRNFLFGSCIFG